MFSVFSEELVERHFSRLLVVVCAAFFWSILWSPLTVVACLFCGWSIGIVHGAVAHRKDIRASFLRGCRGLCLLIVLAASANAATPDIEFFAPSGLGLDLKLFTYGSDTVYETITTVTERSNKKGWYLAESDGTPTLSDKYQWIAVLDGTSTVIASGYVRVNNDESTYYDGATLIDDAITASKIEADAIGSSEIAASAISASEIGSSAITSAKFASGAITATTLATDAITAAKIASGAIVNGTEATGFGTAQTGDSYARLGTPAGASIADDIAAVESQTDDIGVAGAGLTAIPWNSAWSTDFTTIVDTSLSGIGLDHFLSASVSGSDVTDNSIIGVLMSKSGDFDTYDKETDSLEAISDKQ